MGTPCPESLIPISPTSISTPVTQSARKIFLTRNPFMLENRTPCHPHSRGAARRRPCAWGTGSGPGMPARPRAYHEGVHVRKG